MRVFVRKKLRLGSVTSNYGVWQTKLFGNGILGGNSENKIVTQVVMTGTQWSLFRAHCFFMVLALP